MNKEIIFLASLLLSAPPHIVDFSKSPQDLVFKSNEEMLAVFRLAFGHKLKAPPSIIVRSLRDIKNQICKEMKAGIKGIKSFFMIITNNC